MIYNGLTVLTEDPNRRDEPEHTADRSKYRIDSTTGPFTEIDKSGVTRQLRPFSWFLEDRIKIAAFMMFLNERKGALVPFWVPTWQHDLQLVQDLSSSSNSFDVLNMGYSRYQFGDGSHTWRRHLAFIQIGTGIQFIRRIDAAIEGTTAETLTFDSATPAGLVKGQWMLSFLTLCRLDVDSVTINWHGRTSAECQFNVRELPQEMPVL